MFLNNPSSGKDYSYATIFFFWTLMATPQLAYFGTQSDQYKPLEGKPMKLTIKFGISLQKPEMKLYFSIV